VRLKTREIIVRSIYKEVAEWSREFKSIKKAREWANQYTNDGKTSLHEWKLTNYDNTQTIFIDLK
jgi:hypothetical protein